jgi:hemerythrin-like domain-containing protein
VTEARGPGETGGARKTMPSEGSGVGLRMQADHDRLDGLWDRAAELRSGDPRGSERLLREFAAGLERHIALEEELLFPYFEERSEPSGKQLAALLREEHRTIREALAALLAEVDAHAADLRSAETALRNALWAHNALEEGKLYPWFDLRAEDGQDPGLAERVRARLEATDAGP